MKKNKELSIDEKIALALQKQQEEFDFKLKQREENKISLGCKVVELVEIPGKPIMDKETGIQKENNGIPAFYPNKYTAKISFIGGEIETPIKQKDFEDLKIDCRYLAVGRLGEVKEFGNTLIKPIFSQFVEL
ncbi:hypothetical protein AFAEC_1126 [Aliarcobacter faecis]|uniref:hypothetical protein n=1 Tax=Aliarcobacter faecis TaxID=1564138 RepID=UPI00155DAFC3|nr:hypothetical protein [Aliarcobacter faecis]QKF73292.1 hypothetical protein AFAEC_1126 [Aliarcobacter faecis]